MGLAEFGKLWGQSRVPGPVPVWACQGLVWTCQGWSGRARASLGSQGQSGAPGPIWGARARSGVPGPVWGCQGQSGAPGPVWDARASLGNQGQFRVPGVVWGAGLSLDPACYTRDAIKLLVLLDVHMLLLLYSNRCALVYIYYRMLPTILG